MKALILTGGLGTRLRPLTLYTPKPLLPVANRPFLSYQISLLRKHGVKTAVLCTSDSARPYGHFIKEQKKSGMKVICSREFKELGTAGALKNALKVLEGRGNEPVLIFNGDVLTDMDLSGMLDYHKKKRSALTIALVEVPDPSSFGLVLFNKSGEISKFLEKPNPDSSEVKRPYWINAGVYLFEREVFDLIPEGKKFSTERELFPDCLSRNLGVYAYPLKRGAYWLDIGTPEKFLQGNRDILESRLKRILGGKPILDHHTGVAHKEASISPDVTLGMGSRVGKNSNLSNCVLLDHVKVENDCTIENCIVGGGAIIGHHTVIKNARIIGNHSKITPYSQL